MFSLLVDIQAGSFAMRTSFPLFNPFYGIQKPISRKTPCNDISTNLSREICALIQRYTQSRSTAQPPAEFRHKFEILENESIRKAALMLQQLLDQGVSHFILHAGSSASNVLISPTFYGSSPAGAGQRVGIITEPVKSSRWRTNLHARVYHSSCTTRCRVL